MIRAHILITVISVITAGSAAAAAQPAPVVSERPATTRPSSGAELHEQAIESMRLGQLDVAFGLMEKAYAATPAAQRTRPLVLNRAILDLRQKFYVMRAIRDLYQYLRQHPEPDVEAQDILGAALNVAANENPRLKQGPLWQAAFKEWERRNDRLNELRPGYHRWGPSWIADAEYERFLGEKKRLEQALEEQQARTAQAERRATALQTESARLEADIASSRNSLARTGIYGDPRARGGYTIDENGRWIRNTRLGEVERQREINLREAEAVQLATLREARARLAGQWVGVAADLELEKTRLATAKQELQKHVQPAWPESFDPIDPAALTAPPLPPADPQAVAALAERAAKEKARKQSPFGATAATAGPAVRTPTTSPSPAASTPPVQDPFVTGRPTPAPTGTNAPTAPTGPASQVPSAPRASDAGR